MSKKRNDVIIVPWDYTEACEIALLHAIQLAREVNNHVMISRFLESPGMFTSKEKKEKLVADEKIKLKEVGERIIKEHGVNPYVSVELGTSFKHFSRLVEQAKANLFIVGKTYKLNDKMIFSPGDIVKRLRGLNIPFVMTQEKPAHSYYKEIVIPLDHDKNFKETLNWVVYLSKYYNCNINIIKPYISDKDQKKDMANNIYFTKRMLDKKGIVYGIKTSKKNKVFEEEVVRFAEMIDADLIVMMVKKYQSFVEDNSDYKERIPIMVINRNNTIIKYVSFR